jgi:AAA family ATP:ADP antiporter
MRAARLVESFGAARLLIGGVVSLIICVVLVRLVDRLAVRREIGTANAATEKLEAGPSGFTMIFADRYLLLIAAFVLLLNVVNTSGEYLFSRYVVETAERIYGAGPESAAARQQFVGETFGSYFSYVNLLGFLLQLFVVSRVFKFLGVGRALFVHPLVAVTSYVMMLRAPSFETIRVLKIADNAIAYSLGNTTMQALWLPTSRATKYKAKQAIDSFCVRAGDVLQAGVVYGGELTALSVSGFAAINVVMAAVWVGVVVGLQHQRRQRADQIKRAEL